MYLDFRLILGGELIERKKEIEALDKISEDFNPLQMYLFKVNKALYYYATGNRKKAIEFFEQVLSIVDEITLKIGKKQS